MKRSVNVSISLTRDVYELAKKYHIPISQVAELALIKILRKKYNVVPYSVKLERLGKRRKKVMANV